MAVTEGWHNPPESAVRLGGLDLGARGQWPLDGELKAYDRNYSPSLRLLHVELLDVDEVAIGICNDSGPRHRNSFPPVGSELRRARS